jgi:hypothetical protein
MTVHILTFEPKLILMEFVDGYKAVKQIEMERARDPAGSPISRVQAQALALNFAEFQNVDIQAVHLTPEAVKIFVTRKAAS